MKLCYWTVALPEPLTLPEPLVLLPVLLDSRSRSVVVDELLASPLALPELLAPPEPLALLPAALPESGFAVEEELLPLDELLPLALPAALSGARSMVDDELLAAPPPGWRSVAEEELLLPGTGAVRLPEPLTLPDPLALPERGALLDPVALLERSGLPELPSLSALSPQADNASAIEAAMTLI